MQTTANEVAAIAATAAAAQSQASEQLRSAAYWLMGFEEFASAHNTLRAMEHKERFKARPNAATVAALDSGALACWLQLSSALSHVIKRGGLLFVGSPTALAHAKAIDGGAA